MEKKTQRQTQWALTAYGCIFIMNLLTFGHMVLERLEALTIILLIIVVPSAKCGWLGSLGPWLSDK